MKRFGPVLVLVSLLLAPSSPAAGEWTADIVDMEWSPPRFVTVDKNAQSFALMTRQSPLRVVSTVPCATGQELGDKFKEGDLKTPEGVYFITRRRAEGLNYDLYGDLAFPLDFPNPADVLRRKSGHGIWIHGRGHAITPYETQGCVAMNTPDLHRMDAELAEGMPVVIANEVRLGGTDAAKLASEAREVVEATKGWAKAWENRSDAFFGFHDAEKLSITEGKPFAAFKSHKEHLFKALPWIRVSLSEVRAVAGPDYWVTYFVQLYQSPTLISKGIKRLYWQRGADGRFRIIGMEYEEMPVTVADRGKTRAVGQPSADEVETDTRKPDTASEEELQVKKLVDAHTASVEKMAQKAFASLPIKAQPSPEDEAMLDVARNGAVRPGVSPFATDAAPLASPAPAAAPAAKPAPTTVAMATVPTEPDKAPPAKPTAVKEPVPAESPATKPQPTPPVVTQPPAAGPQTPPVAVKPQQSAPEMPTARIAAMLDGWRSAWERADTEGYLGYYADNARLGNLRGKDAIRRQKTGVWKGREPAKVGIELVALAPTENGYLAVCAESYKGEGHRESKGYKSLTLVRDGDGFRILAERWSRGRPAPVSGEVEVDKATVAKAVAVTPAPTATAAKPAAAEPAKKDTPAPGAPDRTAAVAAAIEAWRAAWEKGRIDEYMAFYAKDAVQGGRKGRESIRSQKAALWDDKAPKRVVFSDIKITPDKNGYRVSCVQDYEDRSGARDHGRKTMTLVPAGSGFAIVDEQWSRM